LGPELPFFEWVSSSRFFADREPLNFNEWSHLQQIYQAVPSEPRGMDLTVMKAAQGGATTFALLLTAWLARGGRRQLAYFVPTEQLAKSLSDTRFIPLIRANPELYRLMGDADSPKARRIIDEGSTSMRRIGESIVFFTHVRGRVTTESLPLDAVLFDEVQDMHLSEIERAQERLSASPLRVIVRLSTANFAGSDIDYFFERSDQRVFYTRCRCPGGTALGDAWDARLGPLCIVEGNGATPGVPKGAFFLCPRCRMVIHNPRDGGFRPRKPEVKSIGFHFTQLLSPRQTAATILEKWMSRVDTKNFYNRVLGLPFNDPSSFPVTQEDLERAQNPDLRWGVPAPGSVGEIFMGIDQMGHDNHVVITGRREGRVRLLHLEIVQDENPWRRCAELMEQYCVDVAAVEALPNYNESHRFSREFNGRVFVVNYRELDDEVVLWGDRPRDRPGERPTSDEARTPWTAAVDQYKLMSLSLSKWANGEIETPDARTLLQWVRTSKGYQQVAVCRDMFWPDLQRVALVTEESQGREGERRLRRAVKKLGADDPHYAYAMMLAHLASIRGGGRTLILFTNGPGDETPKDAKRPSPYLEQIMDHFPEAFIANGSEGCCGKCIFRDSKTSWCRQRRFFVEAKLPSCPEYIPISDGSRRC
jgi:hypothetical protein